MGAKKQTSGGNNSAAAAPSAPSNPLASADGRAWLTKKLNEAQTDLRLGPGGTWTSNEGKRPAIVERIAFLTALIALLP